MLQQILLMISSILFLQHTLLTVIGIFPLHGLDRVRLVVGCLVYTGGDVFPGKFVHSRLRRG